MPETVEGRAHYLTSLWGLEAYPDSSRQVQGLWADYTATETKAAEIPEGIVQKLTPQTTLRRGKHGKQTPIIAKELQGTDTEPPAIAITSLALRGVHYSVRALIVDLGLLWLRVAYLTHTSVQVYSRMRWEELLLVSSKLRKFSVALAIECVDFVLAFVSMDKLFQPIWSTTRTGLPVEPPYVLDEYGRFLDGVAVWIKSRWHTSRFDFAVNAIRGASDVWIGIGAYTVNEVFFIAGIPMGIRECELFNSPSRTARLCEAYWAFAQRAEDKLPALLRPAWDRGLLAPSRDERHAYPEKMLYIYGKLSLSLPTSLVQLAEEHNRNVREITTVFEREDIPFWFRSEWLELLPDPFEPAYILESLQSDGKYHLGHLIFPREWNALQSYYQFPCPTRTDPLTLAYTCLHVDIKAAETHLRPISDIQSVFADLSDRSNRRSIKPYAMSTSKKGCLWSLIDLYPSTSRANEKEHSTSVAMKEIPEEHAFIKQSSDKGVAIGAFEWAPNGRVLKQGRRVLRVPMRDHYSAEFSENDVKQLTIRTWKKEYIEKETAKIIKLAKRKGREPTATELAVGSRKLSDTACRQRDRRVKQALEEHHRLFGDLKRKREEDLTPAVLTSGDVNVLPKPKRVSVDKQLLAASAKENIDMGPRATRSRLAMAKSVSL
ncbi:hypothetical protein DFP72DRAFT_1175619 [Ephemerocybe angulata]|uniref:Uncharacterized protein n=1 Tax=Ephemerocybe angulata TaxID=980116 RepID=A0A8H6HGH0_9AGAR|nr:hypothetical protein DFP72DRAFT_1175619 [Tulosesus angulatus]